MFRAYKPDPAVYLGAARVFDVPPAETMLVAAHHDDLAAARACGLQTAYIERPLEFGAAHVRTCGRTRRTRGTRAASTSWPICSAADAAHTRLHST